MKSPQIFIDDNIDPTLLGFDPWMMRPDERAIVVVDRLHHLAEVADQIHRLTAEPGWKDVLDPTERAKLARIVASLRQVIDRHW